jgi:hypothetical protein
MWPILMELLVALVLSGIALGSAHDWASTGRPIGAYVTDCVAADGYQCDYHWATGTGVFAGRLSGEQWPDGHPVRMWVNPNDPADVEATKHVLASAVWFPFLAYDDRRTKRPARSCSPPQTRHWPIRPVWSSTPTAPRPTP